MTSPNDDWLRWARDWQSQPAIDVKQLEHRVRCKRRQMQFMMGAEILITCIATAQVVLLQLRSDISLRWKIWSTVALLFILAMEYALIRFRRGTWRAASGTTVELLRLTAKRARAGIRLAWTNIVGFVVLLAISLPFAAPYLAPSRWRHDPALQHVLILNVSINGAVTIVFMVFYALYIRRQRNRLRKIHALMRDFTEVSPDQNHA